MTCLAAITTITTEPTARLASPELFEIEPVGLADCREVGPCI